MRNLVLALAAVSALAAAPAAFAATKATTTTATTTAAAPSKEKVADCSAQWKAQKKHTQVRKTFMAACTKA